MKYVVLVVFIMLVYPGLSQDKSEIPFIRHLINKGYYNEVIYLIERDTMQYQNLQQDSLDYYRGWAHYSLKNLELSTLSLLEVSRESSFFWKSHFFAGYNQIYLKNYPGAQKIFEEMDIREEPNLSLLNFQQAGMEMLQGNWRQAEQQLELVNTEVATFSEQVSALADICRKQETRTSKSPVLAGIMSGIIPGTGKIYAGKTGAGIASMIGSVGFGLITWENYHKSGIADAKTIIFGSIFVVNYVSNIYGSVVSVKVSENEYNNAIHNQILFQLHIPLRNFFE